MADVILVLTAGGADQETLQGDDAARADVALAAFHAGKAPRIILSGNTSFLTSHYSRESTATAYKRYLCARGVPEICCLCEEHSLDTIGNFYFSRKEFLDPQHWRSIVLVTSLYHMPRAMQLAAMLLGPEFSVESLPAPDTLSGESLARCYEREASKVAQSKQWLALFTPGDIERIEWLLFTLHPAYKR